MAGPEATFNQAVAGWYPNPTGAGHRWWDGQHWTEHVHAPAAPQFAPPAGAVAPVYTPAAVSSGASSLAIVGYVMAIVIPIVGFILGIVAATRQSDPSSSRHGVWIVVASVAAFFVWLAILSSGSGY